MMRDEFNLWEERLISLARHDPWYQECLAEVENLSSGFHHIRDALCEEDRETLDLYISACEELQYSLLQLAHLMIR